MLAGLAWSASILWLGMLSGKKLMFQCWDWFTGKRRLVLSSGSPVQLPLPIISLYFLLYRPVKSYTWPSVQQFGIQTITSNAHILALASQVGCAWAIFLTFCAPCLHEQGGGKYGHLLQMLCGSERLNICKELIGQVQVGG